MYSLRFQSLKNSHWNWHYFSLTLRKVYCPSSITHHALQTWIMFVFLLSIGYLIGFTFLIQFSLLPQMSRKELQPSQSGYFYFESVTEAISGWYPVSMYSKINILCSTKVNLFHCWRLNSASNMSLNPDFLYLGMWLNNFADANRLRMLRWPHLRCRMNTKSSDLWFNKWKETEI